MGVGCGLCSAALRIRRGEAPVQGAGGGGCTRVVQLRKPARPAVGRGGGPSGATVPRPGPPPGPVRRRGGMAGREACHDRGAVRGRASPAVTPRPAPLPIGGQRRLYPEGGSRLAAVLGVGRARAAGRRVSAPSGRAAPLPEVRTAPPAGPAASPRPPEATADRWLLAPPARLPAAAVSPYGDVYLILRIVLPSRRDPVRPTAAGSGGRAL